MFALMQQGRPFKGTLWIGLPEIDAWAEPVVVVIAWGNWFASEKLLADSPLTTVIAENER